MSPRTLLLGLLLAALSADASALTQRPPNILFLFADDHRPDAIGAYGNEHIRTPNLDRLVERGFSFTSAHCMGSIHGAVCQPSRAMLMSGRTLWRVPMNLDGVRTLPEVLHDAGYATFMTGKWHNGEASLRRSFERGQALFLGGMSDHTEVPVRDLDRGTFSDRRTGDRFSSELFADAAIEFLEGYEDDAPFFLYAAFTAPHDPRQPPLADRQWYYEHLPPLPPNFLPQHPFHNGWMVGRDEALAPWPRTEAVIRQQLAEYYGLITHLDRQLGRVLAALEASGHADDTLVVYSADHGLAVGSHGLLGKQSLYEHSMGAPLVVAGPGVPRGGSDALAYLFDLFPTLCEVAGAEPPEGVEGQSLAPLWRGEQTALRETLFTAYEDKMRAVRDGRWKLVRYPRIDHEQLFDLERDPHERTSLAGDPEHGAIQARLSAELERWRAATADPHPLSVESPEPMEIDLSGRERSPDRHQPAWIVEKYFGPQASGAGGLDEGGR